MMQSKIIAKKLKVTVFLSLIIFGLSFYANLSNFIDDSALLALFPPFIKGVDITNNTHLGGEYYNIARAIAEGRGFSDPFNGPTGPTAWMPPLYPLLLSVLIVVFNSQLNVAIAVLFFKNIVLIFTGLTLYSIAKETSSKLKPEWMLCIYLVYLISFFRWFFQITHDMWLILLFVNLVLLTGTRLLNKKLDLKTSVYWGLIGGGAISTSPVLGLTWGLLSIIIFFIFLKKNIPLKRFLIFAVTIFLLINSVWTIRNYVVFKKFIFVKSNLFFDAYKYNFVKENGIPDESFIIDSHLIWADFSEQKKENNSQVPSRIIKGLNASNFKKNEFERYENLGEQKYLKEYERKFKQELSKQPQLFIEKVFNRLLATTLVYYPYNREYESKLLAWRSFIHAVPFCFLLLLSIFQRKIYCHLGCAVFIYVSFLLPYVLISYYIRYSIPLVSLQSLFVFWGLDLVLTKKHMHVKNKSSNVSC